MNNLSRDELAKAQENLRRRFVGPGKDFGVIDLAFGTAVKGTEGEIDAHRGLAVCFFVKRKRRPRDPKARLPREVRVRIRRDGKYRYITFKTDVIATKQARLTGVRLSYRSETDFVTAGTIVTWLSGSPSVRQWAIITVGHAFNAVNASNLGANRVRIKSPSGARIIVGSLVWKCPDEEYDIAVIKVAPNDLIAAGLMTSEALPNPLPPRRSLNELKADAKPGPHGGALGQSLRYPSATGPGFRVKQFFPSLGPGIIMGVTRLDNVIRVEASPGPSDGAFPERTSGSNWYVAGMPAAIQIAAIPNAWLVGFGQAIIASAKIVELNLRHFSDKRVSDFVLVSSF